VDVITVLTLSTIAGGGLVGLWMMKEEDAGVHSKLLVTAIGSVLFAATLGLTIPPLAGSGPVHEAMTFLEVLSVIATSSLALAVLGGGALGGIVVGYLVDRSRKVG
jgi:hypothetical protein